MAFEEEVMPLMIGGVLLISALEAAVGWVFLRGRKSARGKLLAHTLLMLGGFYFLFRCIFASRMGIAADIPSISNSAAMGLFGLLWAGSVACIIAVVSELTKGG
jgi:hypothetical protein